MGAVAILLAGADAGQIAGEHRPLAMGQFEPLLVPAAGAEQA
jgi:hypothetical protein